MDASTQTESHDLPDVLPFGLKAVICGTAAGTTSAALGAYYADPRNKFWNILQQAGLTPRKLAPNEFVALHKFGLGLTDIAKTVSGTDANLPLGAFNVAGFVDKVRHCQPGIVAFNGKEAARVLYGLPRHATKTLTYGLSELRPRIRTFRRLSSFRTHLEVHVARGSQSIGKNLLIALNRSEKWGVLRSGVEYLIWLSRLSSTNPPS